MKAFIEPGISSWQRK